MEAGDTVSDVVLNKGDRTLRIVIEGKTDVELKLPDSEHDWSDAKFLKGAIIQHVGFYVLEFTRCWLTYRIEFVPDRRSQEKKQVVGSVWGIRRRLWRVRLVLLKLLMPGLSAR